MSSRIEARGLYKRFLKGDEEIEVLRNASFVVEPGSSVAIVGKSGAGKSTLLHVLGTLEQPDSGEVFFGDERIDQRSLLTLPKFRSEKVGFVFQFHHLLSEFSAIENVMLPLMIAGKSRKEAEGIAEETLGLVHLSHRKTHQPGELSGGEQQRVALARALVNRPPVLLVDEVTGNLDAKTGKEVTELLTQLQRDLGTTLVAVTHDPHFASVMQRRLLLEGGEIREDA